MMPKWIDWNNFKKSTLKKREIYKFKVIDKFYEGFKFARYEYKKKEFHPKYWFFWLSKDDDQHLGFLDKHIPKYEGVWLIKPATKIEKQKLVEEQI